MTEKQDVRIETSEGEVPAHYIECFGIEFGEWDDKNGHEQRFKCLKCKLFDKCSKVATVRLHSHAYYGQQMYNQMVGELLKIAYEEAKMGEEGEGSEEKKIADFHKMLENGTLGGIVPKGSPFKKVD